MSPSRSMSTKDTELVESLTCAVQVMGDEKQRSREECSRKHEAGSSVDGVTHLRRLLSARRVSEREVAVVDVEFVDALASNVEVEVALMLAGEGRGRKEG